MKTTIVTLAVAALCALGSASPLEPGLIARDDDKTIRVKGGSIQQAIDKAKKGTKIIIDGGMYSEQLTIKKDGITLEGRNGATLYPPHEYKKNDCTGVAATLNSSDPTLPETQAGICIQGDGIVPAEDFGIEHYRVKSVKSYIKDVSVRGLTVKNFDVNILVIGAKNTDVKDNTLIDGDRYGFLTVGSYDTTFKENKVTSTDDTNFIAVCMDDLGGARAIENKLSGYGIGFCVQTNNGVWKRNTVKNTCSGFVIDAHISGPKIIDNSITDPKAPGSCGNFVLGVFILGASNVELRGNTIKGHNAPAPPGGFGAGVFVADDPCDGTFGQSIACLYTPGPSIAAGNVIKGNTIKKNSIDIVIPPEDGIGAANVVKDNDCETSFPEGLCK